MKLLIVSFLAGILTIVTSCGIALFIVMLCSTVLDLNNKKLFYTKIISLAFGLFVFAILLKSGLFIIGINPYIWNILSGFVIILFGLFNIFPGIKKKLPVNNFVLSIFVGISLGLAFYGCSPTYNVILSVILPNNFLNGLIYLLVYVIGLSYSLIFIGLLLQQYLKKIKKVDFAEGIFSKILGIIILIVGLFIISGFGKYISKESYILQIEQQILDKVKIQEELSDQKLFRFGFKTNTNKISINFKEILKGGPGKDGIPAINNPKFISNTVALDNMNYLTDESRGISVSLGGEAKFYPYAILVWHEIVNDMIGNKSISVTFCPLCGSSIVYDRIIDGHEIHFGVSGLLYESNMLMYHDLTQSLWSQSYGKGVVGDYVGKELEYIKSNVMTFKEFKKNYPKGLVLSDDTGFSKKYGDVLYGDYNDTEYLYFRVRNIDLRYKKKEIFYIVNDGEESIAFYLKDLTKNGSGEIKVGGDIYKATFNDGIIDVYKGNELIEGYYEMWFSWINHNMGSRNVWRVKNK